MASARDDVVTSFDGTPIVVHFFDAATLPADGRAPTVLVGPPYPTPGETRAELDVGDRIGLATLRAPATTSSPSTRAGSAARAA